MVMHCKKTSQKELFPAGLEPATFRVLGRCDNHYTTETTLRLTSEIFNFSFDLPLSTNRGKSLLFFLLLLVGIVITDLTRRSFKMSEVHYFQVSVFVYILSNAIAAALDCGGTLLYRIICRNIRHKEK